MDKVYLEQLPEKISVLAKEIEEYSGKEILVLQNPYPISQSDPNPDGLACSVDENTAKIYFRDKRLDIQGFTHELLHIHRYWVRNIPQILPTNAKNIHITSNIENSIEHITIVHEEARYGLEPYTHWNSTCRKNWENFDPQSMNKLSIRKNCLLGYLTVSNLVNDEAVITLAEKKIKKQGLLNIAKQMNVKMKKHSNSKEKQISCVVNFLKLPRKELKIVYFNVRKGTRTEEDICKYKA